MDISTTLEAKSDQLNAMDIMSCQRVIRIRRVDVKAGDQPVSVFFDGDNNKPWKPSLGMRRAMARAYGNESDNWIGKHVELYFDPEVTWAGKAVGGIKIKAVSDIAAEGINMSIQISKQKRSPLFIARLEVKADEYPSDRFAKALPIMAAKMEAKEMTLQQVIAQCQKTGILTQEQTQALEAAAPVDNEEEM